MNGSRSADNEFVSIKRFRIVTRRVAFHPPQAEERSEELLRKPAFARLTRETLQDGVQLATAERGVQGDEDIGGTEIPIVLGNLVLQDEVITERVQREFRDEPVILVQVAPIVSEDQVRGDRGLQLLEDLLDLRSLVREEAVAKA